MEDEGKFMPLLLGKGARGSGSGYGVLGQAVWLVTFGKTGGDPWYGENWFIKKYPGGIPAILTANICPPILYPFKFAIAAAASV